MGDTGPHSTCAGAGATGFRRLEAELLSLKVGLKLEGKFASEEAQARDPAFAGEYRLLFEAGLEPGAAVEGFFAFIKVTALKLEAKLLAELATSPKGSLGVIPGTFKRGADLKFDVALRPETLSFPLIGYNAKKVRVYRKVVTGTDLALVLVGEASFAEGESTARVTGVATEDGTAAEFVAFLSTGFLDPLTIELDPGPALDLELEAPFPATIPSDKATPLKVTARLRDTRTNTIAPAAGATVTVHPTRATVSSAGNLTDMAGELTVDVRPGAGETSVSLEVVVQAANGAEATTMITAMVSSGPICDTTNPRTTGSLFISSAAEAAAAADVGVTGALTIRGGNGAFAVELPCLKQVASISASGDGLTQLHLPALTTVTSGNGVVVFGAPNLTSVRLPALKSSGGWIAFGTVWFELPIKTFPNDNLTELILGPVQIAGTDALELLVNPKLTDLSGISGGVRAARFNYGVDGIANGFGRTQALALANRITVTTQVCEATDLGAPTCFSGPPWGP